MLHMYKSVLAPMNYHERPASGCMRNEAQVTCHYLQLDFSMQQELFPGQERFSLVTWYYPCIIFGFGSSLVESHCFDTKEQFEL